MNRLKNTILFIVLSLFIIGCSNNKNETIEVDSITIEYKDEYKINNEDSHINIIKESRLIATGIVIDNSLYNEYKETINKTANTKLLDSYTYKDNNYILFSYDDEYIYIININNSDKALMLKSKEKEALIDVFKNIKIKK